MWKGRERLGKKRGIGGLRAAIRLRRKASKVIRKPSEMAEEEAGNGREFALVERKSRCKSGNHAQKGGRECPWGGKKTLYLLLPYRKRQLF